jgi:hypothetical protein
VAGWPAMSGLSAFICVHRRQEMPLPTFLGSSAAGSAFADFSWRLLALGKMFSYLLALSGN